MTIAPSFTDASLAAGNKIGRYFSIVSVLPSLFLVLWVAALIISKAWRSAPDLDLLAETMSRWSVGGVAWLVVATLLLSVFLHPLQFAMTQLFEGYWGRSRLAHHVMRVRIHHHRKLQHSLTVHKEQLTETINESVDAVFASRLKVAIEHGSAQQDQLNPGNWDEEEREFQTAGILDSQLGEPLIDLLADKQADETALRNYPTSPSRILPTRLGNVLRRAEDSAGGQYGLSSIRTVPHLSLVVSGRHLQYLDDSREQLDIAVRLCTISLLATASSIAALLTDGFWLLFALIPYSFAYLAYRASVAAAKGYAAAISVVIDLDRFTLYESLRIDIPQDTEEERAVNAELMALISGDDEANVQYAQPPAPARKRRTHLAKDEKPNEGIP